MVYRIIFVISFLIFLFPGFANSQTEISSETLLTITGNVSSNITINAKDLAKLKRHTIKVQDHGVAATYEGVALYDVLQDKDIPFGEKLRGEKLSLFALVIAKDNYKAVFSLTEFDPMFTDEIILLADKRDGKLLSEHEGKLRLVVPNEKRQARWVRQVMTIKILDANDLK